MKWHFHRVGLVAALSLAAALPAQAADVTLRMTSCFVTPHDQTQTMLQTFLKPFNDQNAGIKLNHIGGPEVTPFNKQAAALQRGLVDLIHCPASYYIGLLPAARFPGINTIEPAELRKNGGWEMMQEQWKKINAKILGWGHWKASTFYILTINPPKLSDKTGLDLTGIKVRSTGLYTPFLKAMNGTPITIAPGDVYASLERGLVEAIAWPEGSIAAYGWQKFLKYRLKQPFFHSTTLVTMNLNKFNSLSKAHQDLLIKMGEQYEINSNPVLAKKSAIDNEKLQQAGIKDIVPPDAVRKAFLKTVYGAKWKEIADYGKFDFDWKALRDKMYKEPSF